jgi:uncharacterized protein YcbK (DUF882 family)
MKILLLSDLQKISRFSFGEATPTQLLNLYNELKLKHFSVPFIDDKSTKSQYVDKLNLFYRDVEKKSNQHYKMIHTQLDLFEGVQ